MLAFESLRSAFRRKHEAEYKPVAEHEEDGQNPRPSFSRGDSADHIALLDSGSQGVVYKAPRKSRSRLSCRLSCCLVLKASVIIVIAVALWYSYRLLRWATDDTSPSVDLMPAYSTSLGCLSAPYIYNSSVTLLKMPPGPNADHEFDIRGSAVGTFTIAQDHAQSEFIEYELQIRATSPSLLHDVFIRQRKSEEDPSRLVIYTPFTDSSSCLRFDITMRIPKSLKKLNIRSHSTTHVQFNPYANLHLEALYVTLFSMDTNNMILPHTSVKADQIALEVYRGWIVGDVAIVNVTTITTQRGDGITNVRAHPVDVDPPLRPVSLRTTTGAGRTDIFYISSKTQKRQIKNTHISARNADVYLVYSEADYNGRIELDSRSYTAKEAKLVRSNGHSRIGNSSGEPHWTHSAGDENGGDMLIIKSRGWTGLYF